MSTLDKAARVIDQWTQEGYELNHAVGSPHAIAERLADAGLLAPDLPEPNDSAIFVPNGKGWLPAEPGGPVVCATPGGLIMVQRIEPGDLAPDEARQVAYTLLAAANYSEDTE